MSSYLCKIFKFDPFPRSWDRRNVSQFLKQPKFRSVRFSIALTEVSDSTILEISSNLSPLKRSSGRLLILPIGLPIVRLQEVGLGLSLQ